MKKHMLCYILTIGCGMLLSCNSPSAKIESLETISVGKAYANLTKLKVSDYFQTVRYVPLETNDSVLVGDNPKLCVYKDLLIVSSPQEQCYVFSFFIRLGTSVTIRRAVLIWSAGLMPQAGIFISTEGIRILVFMM